ncbi:MAG: glycosyltransferase family 2 protein [Candidatus Levybacteria bacterium]|nr:glycosyltransferase family 2 protein [Candidatus Levybacteria bacterium]
MHFIFPAIIFLVIFLGIINLFRMTFFLIGSDIYNFKKHLRRNKKIVYFPTISVVIPAFNEEKSIKEAVKSVLLCDYPKERLELIVVDDGSNDGTREAVENLNIFNTSGNSIFVSQENMGKANALNNGIKNYVTGELVMCLDADSYLAKDALMKVVGYFEDEKVVAVASNVKIASKGGLINFIQMIEYIISYQMKRAQTVFNIEYIVGGIGSTFRKSFIEKINFYDTDTVTEDIDLTMKILRHGNKNVRVIYASDVISYTQAAITIRDLIRQRYRWKWGRYQTFLKNSNLFFSGNKIHTKGLSWIYLPFALFSDLAFIFEPLVVLFIAYLVIFYSDYLTLLSAMTVISFYLSMSVISEDTIDIKTKVKLILLTPATYFLFYILSFVEYLALIKSLIKLPHLRNSLFQDKSNWKPIERRGIAPYN